jgi:hypothetical protein
MSSLLSPMRRMVLGGSGVLFGVIALLATVAPRIVAGRYAYGLESVDSFNQFRAVFVGFWSALALIMITAARRPDLRLLGDLCGWALVLQAAGRASSFALDGLPSATFIGAFALELISGAVVLLAPRALPAASPQPQVSR